VPHDEDPAIDASEPDEPTDPVELDDSTEATEPADPADPDAEANAETDVDDESAGGRSTPPETTLAVILAAGAGSRFVGDHHKLAAKLKKKPLVWWASQHAIAAGFAEVLVVEGATPVADLVPAEASVVHNDDWADGQSRSLHVAVHYATMFGYGEIVVGLGDQPFVPPEAWRKIARSKSPIAVAEFDGQNTPPVRLSEEVWRLLPLDGDEGARQLLRSRPELVTPIPCPGSAIDVDTAGEFDQVRRHHLTKELGSWI
jgi:CTP:molybdopterin cytidylyltransferase MocA